MRSFATQLAWLAALGASPVLASFEDFSFAGNGGNSSAPRKCGDMIYECKAPNMCSLDTLTRKWYCCEPGNKDGPCWNGASTCGGSGTNQPSAQQIGCTNLDVNYCCADSEECTKNAKQFRICWSKQENPIRFLNSTQLNQTYTSLSSASPRATSITIDRTALFALTSTTPGASPTSSAPASNSASATSSPSTAPSSDDSGLSGGAIGGIVGGVVGGLALLAGIGFLLWRKKKASSAAGTKTNPYDAPGDPYQNYAYQPSAGGAHEVPGYAAPQQMSTPMDKYAYNASPGPVEVPANQGPVEMEAGYYAQHAQPQSGQQHVK